MNKKIVFAVFAVIALFEVYLLYQNYRLNYEVGIKNQILQNTTIKLQSMVTQFSAGIENNGKKINEETVVKDISGKSQSLGSFWANHNGNLLVCRYSEKHCYQCVDYAIANFLKSISDFDAQRILFVGDNSNSRVAKLKREDFGITEYNYIDCHNLGIPAEEWNFPYYIVIDKMLAVKCIYFPNKSTRHLNLDSANLNLMYRQLVANELVGNN